MQNGLICKKIHRILAFHQSPWLTSYINLNSQKRCEAKNSFEKDFFKLMNNAIFGKTIENVDKRVDIKLCTRWEDEATKTKCKFGLSRYISRPNFHSCTISCEDLVAVQLNKENVLYNKPISVGFTVLELSKLLMYDFHYNYMLRKYGANNVNLLYTDTDSFIYEIKTRDFYNDIKIDLDRFDTSNFSADNEYNLPLVNKKVVGLMKDENGGKIMTKFIGLRSKMYAYTLNGDDYDENVVKKNKGVTASVVRKLQFENYVNCLNLSQSYYNSLNTLVSKKHDVYSQNKRKKVLCGNDDKRYIISSCDDDDGVVGGKNTLAWGHCNIQYNTY